MIDIVIPVYNEKDNIKYLLDDISNNVKNKIRIIIVYDSLEDNTISVINKIKQNYTFDILCIKNLKTGVVEALKTGFLNCKSEYILVLMADLSDDISIIDNMYNLVKKNYDIVCPSRYCKYGKQIGGPFFKKFLSKTAGKSLKLITQIKLSDWTNNYRLYRKSFLDSIDIESFQGFEIGIEILYKAYKLKRKIIEIPCIWSERKSGKSKFKVIKWFPCYLKWYIKIILESYKNSNR